MFWVETAYAFLDPDHVLQNAMKGLDDTSMKQKLDSRLESPVSSSPAHSFLQSFCPAGGPPKGAPPKKNPSGKYPLQSPCEIHSAMID
ncbi:hypothetical protein BCON_0066g00110 [Botryotinia convoluta]|uniref:Uncharacterized protein n=1 Tax=Botryotinia convoluta TaxID=54673 RepID=A0A4Z1ICT0_9HELO|nr:hypothetical protein BCON_0066g00110 [Botryotinia convoluta]